MTLRLRSEVHTAAQMFEYEVARHPKPTSIFQMRDAQETREFSCNTPSRCGGRSPNKPLVLELGGQCISSDGLVHGCVIHAFIIGIIDWIHLMVLLERHVGEMSRHFQSISPFCCAWAPLKSYSTARLRGGKQTVFSMPNKWSRRNMTSV